MPALDGAQSCPSATAIADCEPMHWKVTALQRDICSSVSEKILHHMDCFYGHLSNQPTNLCHELTHSSFCLQGTCSLLLQYEILMAMLAYHFKHIFVYDVILLSWPLLSTTYIPNFWNNVFLNGLQKFLLTLRDDWRQDWMFLCLNATGCTHSGDASYAV